MIPSTLVNTRIKALIDAVGKNSTLIEYTRTAGRDAHGDSVFTSTSRTIRLARAFQTNTRAPATRIKEPGPYEEFAVEFYTYDPALMEYNQTADSKNPEVIYEGSMYRILEVEPMTLGCARAIAYKERDV